MTSGPKTIDTAAHLGFPLTGTALVILTTVFICPTIIIDGMG
jgi:chromate transport protein ChrA